MQMNYLNSLYYTFIPAAAVILSLIIGLSIKPRGIVIQMIQALAAGILLAGIAVELLPQLHFSQYGLSLSIAVLLGLVLMLILGRLNPACCSSEEKSTSLSAFISGFSIEFTINGLVIVLSVLASQFASMLTAISLAICCFVCGLSVTTRCMTVELSKQRTSMTVSLMALLFPVGGLLGMLFLNHISMLWAEEIMAFGMGVLLYIATADLLLEGFKSKSYWPKISLYLGFLLIVCINAYSHTL